MITNQVISSSRGKQGESSAATVSGCRFCEHLAGNTVRSPEWEVVAESDNLVAVPSVGSLVAGWLLVVPKAHRLSFGESSDMSVLHRETEEIAAEWRREFGPLTWFEHGPAQPSSVVGCSVDHAHIHLLPSGELDLEEAASRHLPELTFVREDDPESAIAAAVEAGIPYLHLRLPDGTSRLAVSPRIPSQAFRRCIAAEQGRPDQFDWREFPQLETLEETMRRWATAGAPASMAIAS